MYFLKFERCGKNAQELKRRIKRATKRWDAAGAIAKLEEEEERKRQAIAKLGRNSTRSRARIEVERTNRLLKG